MTIRTNAHPIVMSSGGIVRRFAATHNPRNMILAYARDLYDGSDTFGWAMELLYATQVLRMAYDSPRIGGGIDPALATRLPGLEDARADCPMLGYMIGSENDCDYDPEGMGVLDNLDGNLIQDMIVHAEEVARRLITQCTIAGTDY